MSSLPGPVALRDVLYRLKRGLAGYVSYLAACEMNGIFSEYILYEPVLRILRARGFDARCEVPCPGVRQALCGDRKRIDFRADGHGLQLAIEVKWAKRAKVNVQRDHQKLVAFRDAVPGARSFLCVFGRASHIRQIDLVPNRFGERGSAVFADFGITKYGCRIFEA